MDSLEDVFRDPITMEIMENAVVTKYGHSFSEFSITEWIKMNPRCPITNQPLQEEDIKPNYSLRKAISLYYYEKQKKRDESFMLYLEQLPYFRKRMIELKTDQELLKYQLKWNESNITLHSEKKSVADEEKNTLISVLNSDRKRRDREEIILQSHKQRIISLEQYYSSLSNTETELYKKSIFEYLNLFLLYLSSLSLSLSLLFPLILYLLERGMRNGEEDLKLDKTIEQNKFDKEETSREIALSQKKREDCEKEIEHIQKEIKEKENRLFELIEKINTLSDQLSHCREKKGTFQDRIRQYTSEIDKVMNEVDKAEKETQLLHKDLQKEMSTPIPSNQSELVAKLKEEGTQLFQEKKYQKSIELYSNAIDTLNPYFDASLFLNRAAAYQSLQLYDQSIKDCQIVIDRTTHNWTLSKAHRRLATAYIYTNQEPNAMQEISLALSIDENDKEAIKLMKFLNDKKREKKSK